MYTDDKRFSSKISSDKRCSSSTKQVYWVHPEIIHFRQCDSYLFLPVSRISFSDHLFHSLYFVHIHTYIVKILYCWFASNAEMVLTLYVEGNWCVRLKEGSLKWPTLCGDMQLCDYSICMYNVGMGYKNKTEHNKENRFSGWPIKKKKRIRKTSRHIIAFRYTLF